MTAVIHSKSERIDVRASTPVKHLLQETACVAHKNVSEFLLDAGILAANQALEDRTRFELSAEKWLAFQTALDQPVAKAIDVNTFQLRAIANGAGHDAGEAECLVIGSRQTGR